MNEGSKNYYHAKNIYFDVKIPKHHLSEEKYYQKVQTIKLNQFLLCYNGLFRPEWVNGIMKLAARFRDSFLQACPITTGE